MRVQPYDELTVESWPKEPRLSNLSGPDIDDVDDVDDRAPALWKDLTLAVLVAVLLWFVAVGVVE